MRGDDRQQAAQLAALAEKDRRRAKRLAALDAMAIEMAARLSVGPDGLAEDGHGGLHDWHESLRQLLKGLIGPETVPGDVRVQGVTTYRRLLAGCVQSVVPPGGDEHLCTVAVGGFVRAGA